VENGVNQKKKF